MKGRKVLILVSEDWYFLSHRLPLARRLKEQGADVVVACRVNNGKEKIEKEGFRLCPIELSRDSLSPATALKTVSQLKRLYRSEKPDLVIHVALFTVLLGTLAGLQSGVKSIVNMVTGLGFVFIAETAKAKIIQLIVKSFFRLFSWTSKVHMIVQNKDDQALMSGLGFKMDKNLWVIRGSGVDAQFFSPAVSQPEEKIVTFVGRMLWAKGVAELIEAARILKERGKSYRIVLVGDPDLSNPQSATPDDMKKWQDEGLVECWGRRSDIADIYRQSTIAVLPSWREGLPKSLLEAAACGLPMIATDVPGCREIVQHEENGLLVKLRSADEIANAIERLMEDDSLRVKCGKNARKLIEDELNDQAIMDKTIALLSKL